MTGWSGDGAPGNGTLREFSTGAVVQHFTKSLDRVEGQDFRLPTDFELDALQAFMLSLGGQGSMDLQTLRLKDAAAERGRLLFITEDSEFGTKRAARCNACHTNAGALTVAGINQNLDTGVEGVVTNVDLQASTVTVDSDGVVDTIRITSDTEFKGSIAASIVNILVGYVAQGEFFTSVGEAVWIEAELPPGL